MDVRTCRMKYRALAPALTERARRLWAATEARAAGRGGIAGVVRATGIAYSTIRRGLKDLEAAPTVRGAQIRRPGGGRKRTQDKDPTLWPDLEGLIEPTEVFERADRIGCADGHDQYQASSVPW